MFKGLHWLAISSIVAILAAIVFVVLGLSLAAMVAVLSAIALAILALSDDGTK